MEPATLCNFEIGEQSAAPQPTRSGKVALAVGATCALLLVGFITASCTMSSQAFSKEAAPLGLHQLHEDIMGKSSRGVSAKYERTKAEAQAEFEEKLKRINELQEEYE